MNSIVDDGGILPALTDEILVHRLQLLPVVVVSGSGFADPGLEPRFLQRRCIKSSPEKIRT